MSQTEETPTGVQNPHGIYINMEQFTKNATVHPDEEYIVTGEGIFDIMMDVATKHLKAQFDAGRINSGEYAQTYAQMYQNTLQASVQIWLQKPLAEIQKEAEEAKKALYYRQIEGFDQDYNQKIFKQMLDSWAVGFSVSRDFIAPDGQSSIPAVMTKQAIDDVFNSFITPNLNRFYYGRDMKDTNTANNQTLRYVDWGKNPKNNEYVDRYGNHIDKDGNKIDEAGSVTYSS